MLSIVDNRFMFHAGDYLVALTVTFITGVSSVALKLRRAHTLTSLYRTPPKQ